MPGEFALYDRLSGGRDDRVLREPAGRRRYRRTRQSLIDRFEHRSDAEVQGVLEGQQAEDRARHRPPAPARAAYPRRADVGTRPARPADVLRGHPRGAGGGPNGLPVEPHPLRGRADVRPGGDHPALARDGCLGAPEGGRVGSRAEVRRFQGPRVRARRPVRAPVAPGQRPRRPLPWDGARGCLAIAGDAVVDGEACVLDEAGRPSFSALQQGTGTLVFFAFDCLEAAGEPFLDLPSRSGEPAWPCCSTPVARR